MKKPSKELITIATGMALGGTLGVLFAPEKGYEMRKKLETQARKLAKSFDGNCSREQLEMVKEKMEQHKVRLEKHLQKINSKLSEFETKA